MIEVENLSKRYGEKLAVDGLVQPGIVTGLLGPNRAGKSTTIRMIAGLDKPTTGKFRVSGQDYRAASAPLAELGIVQEARAVHAGRSARHRAPAQIPSRLSASTQHQLVKTNGRLIPAGEVNG
jgi:ABC-2 type transport system ATP-binding protein